MSEYTPTRNEILTALVHYRASGKGHPAHIGELAGRDEVHEYLEESLRGLLELERVASEKAWDEGFDLATRNNPNKPHPMRALNPYRSNEGE